MVRRNSVESIDVTLASHRVRMESGGAAWLLRPLRNPTTFLENWMTANSILFTIAPA